jgi:predicted phage tail protein
MVTIRLLGEAGRRFGRVFRLSVRSAGEAVRALCLQIPELRQYLVQSTEHGIAWRVVTEDPLGLAEDELDWPCSKRVVLAPQPTGRGGGVGKIIAGVALVAFAILFPAGGALASSFFTLGSTAAAAIGSIGVSLIFSGVAQLLTPTPKMPGVVNTGGAITDRGNTDQQKSALFDKSNANTAQGDVVPVLYGERLVGSLPVLSFGIELQNSL